MQYRVWFCHSCFLVSMYIIPGKGMLGTLYDRAQSLTRDKLLFRAALGLFFCLYSPSRVKK